MITVNCRAGRWSVVLLSLILVVGLLLGRDPVAHADLITLRGGGQIHGKLITTPANPKHLTFIGMAGKNPILYRPEQIVQVVPEKSVLDEYVVKRQRERTLAEEEFQVGSWCEERKLRDLATFHFEAAIRLDHNYAPAQEKVGHTLVDGRWLDADELREAQGMVKYHGRWMMPEEKERLEDQAAQQADNQSWVRRIKIYRDAFLSGQETRAKDAEQRLLAIRDTAAVGPVTRVLGDDPNTVVRLLACRVLAAIVGPEATAALVHRLLAETDSNVREALIAELGRRDSNDVVPPLVRSLRSKQAVVVNRAAWGLGRLNAITAVPQLISALTFVEYRTEMVPIGVGPGAGGGINASFSSPGGGGFGNYTASAYVQPTPATVAPGAVAFGAVGVPLVNGVALGNGGGGGLSIGGGGSEMKYMPRMVTIEHPNVEVHTALASLTGQDFGFDVGSWKRWASSSFRSDATPPGRRVVSP